MIGKLSSQQIEQVLLSQTMGRIGCHCESLTYVVPVSYAYDGERIIAHSAEGMKVQMMRTNPEVCFQVDDVDDLANWRSVISWGTFKELSGDDAALAMGFLVERMRPLMVSESLQHHHGAQRGVPFRGVVYEIRLKIKTGRYEKPLSAVP
jgi:uncharacterized protein